MAHHRRTPGGHASWRCPSMRRATAIIPAIFWPWPCRPPRPRWRTWRGQGVRPTQRQDPRLPLKQLAIAWNSYALASAPEYPLITPRCEQSPTDKRIWFGPDSIGGDDEVDCEVPTGAFLVATPPATSVNPSRRAAAALRRCAPARSTAFDTDVRRGLARRSPGEESPELRRDDASDRAGRTEPAERRPDARHRQGHLRRGQATHRAATRSGCMTSSGRWPSG